jgi:hypothetical protein
MEQNTQRKQRNASSFFMEPSGRRLPNPTNDTGRYYKRGRRRVKRQSSVSSNIRNADRRVPTDAATLC